MNENPKVRRPNGPDPCLTPFRVVGNEHDALALTPAPPTVDYSRYPYRIPDWLWRDARRSASLDASHRALLDLDIKILAELSKRTDSDAADAKETAIQHTLNRTFSLHDLSAGGIVCTARNTGAILTLQLDPEFDARTRSTLVEASTLFLSCLSDNSIAAEALTQSIDEPQPMPVQYEMTSDGTPQTDDLDRPVFTDAYKLYLRTTSRPASLDIFQSRINSAFSARTGIAPLLVISKYTGNDWWGRSYYHYAHSGACQLTAFAPPEGFLYIALNSDKLQPGIEHWNDSAFWASKIAHECLHTLGFWHPGYKDPAERDANNAPGRRAFIVAYEFAVLERLREGRFSGTSQTSQ